MNTPEDHQKACQKRVSWQVIPATAALWQEREKGKEIALLFSDEQLIGQLLVEIYTPVDLKSKKVLPLSPEEACKVLCSHYDTKGYHLEPQKILQLARWICGRGQTEARKAYENMTPEATKMMLTPQES